MTYIRVAVWLIAALLVAACDSFAPVRVAPPAEVYATATVPGVPRARLWGDGIDERTIAEDTQRVSDGLRTQWESAGRPDGGIDVDILALSGGGSDGAFAAGLLNGWSQSGKRPKFELVTGISVGALIAPFAFLGTDYDPALRVLFTEFDTAEVVVFRPFRLLFGALGVIDTQPLRRTIGSLVDEAMLKRVAEEHNAGRRLLIGTTNIDAGRPVIWNMGEIALAGDRELFADVMLASASIPGAFPPVLIEVEGNDERFGEFHVDGGVTRSVILWPTGAERMFPRFTGISRSGTVYVIQNNQLLPPYQPLGVSVRQIATRSLSTLIRGQTEGDLTRIYLAAREVGYDFRLIFVPPNNDAPGTTDFDPAYMRRLFLSAETIGRGEIPWFSAPPGIADRPHLLQALESAMIAAGREPVVRR